MSEQELKIVTRELDLLADKYSKYAALSHAMLYQNVSDQFTALARALREQNHKKFEALA
jgi:hypothetical protein